MAEDGSVPDVYCDQFTVMISPYGTTITFLLSPSAPGGHQTASTPQVVLRMSLEHAKVLAMMLRRNLKHFELEQLGDPIRVPMGLLHQLGLDPEAW